MARAVRPRLADWKALKLSAGLSVGRRVGKMVDARGEPVCSSAALDVDGKNPYGSISNGRWFFFAAEIFEVMVVLAPNGAARERF